MIRFRGFYVVIALLFTITVCLADNWPQFRGTNRDGKSAQTGMMTSWPDGGPKLLWSYNKLGKGYTSVAIVDDTIYTTGMIEDQGYLFALGTDGAEKWTCKYGPEWTGSYPGTRSTPTIDGDRLYIMSGKGHMICIDMNTHKIKWSVDTLRKFSGKNIHWGIAESVLIDGDKAICTPGGKDASVVALNKMTGETIWTSKGISDLSAYCSPVIINHNGKRILLTMLANTNVALDPDTGEKLWQFDYKNNYDISAVSPVYDKGLIYYTNGYRNGSMVYELSQDGTKVTQKWMDEKNLDCHHGGVILLDGHIYGASSNGQWTCLDMATGEVKQKEKLVGKGSACYVGGMFYCYGERKGDVVLAKASPTGFETKGTFRVTAGTNEHWAHPVACNGILYIRHGDTLLAYDVKK